MSRSLTPGPETFSKDHLRAVWHEARQRPWTIGLYQSFEDDVKHIRKTRFCLELHTCVRDPVLHRERIEERFGSFLSPRFRMPVSADVVCVGLLF